MFGKWVLKIIAALKGQGKKMSNKDCDNQETIWTAAVNGDWETVKQLLEREPSLINVTDDGGVTLLHFAASNSNIVVLEYLISQGADVNVKAQYGETPLHWATRWNSDVDVLEYLVSRGNDVNVKEIYGHTPLHFAAMVNSSVEVLKCLVSKGADVNARNCWDDTPLYEAAGWNDNAKVLEYLISQGADVNAKNEHGETALDIADTDEKKNFLRGCIQGK